MRLDWLHKIMTGVLVTAIVIACFFLLYGVGPHETTSDTILYSLCSLISSLIPIFLLAIISIGTNLFPKSLFSFSDRTKRIYHDRCQNIYINYNNNIVTIYQLGFFTIKKIDFISLNEESFKKDIDTALKKHFISLDKTTDFKRGIDDWDGTIGNRMRRDKRLDDILK